MGSADLRAVIDRFDALGELKVCRGAHWDLEIGAITEIMEHRRGTPAVLFDAIVGYPEGYRVVTNVLGSPRRISALLGLPEDLDYIGLVQVWRKRIHDLEPVPIQVVASGPVEENVRTGTAIDLNSFPAPRWHALDGGRYIGTGCLVITRDPDTGVVNMGTYRNQVLGQDAVGCFVADHSKHAGVHWRKYFARGQACPIVLVFGSHPALYVAATLPVPEQISELDFAGGLMGEPVPVLEGRHTGLPFPAAAEIVVEGEIHPDDVMLEGPFGEWTGYYGNPESLCPVVRVKRLLYRDNPVILGVPPVRPPSNHSALRAIEKSATIWNALEAAGVPDVHGVWCHEAGGTRLFNVVAIQQRYPGHAAQAGLIASQCEEAIRLGRYVVVVDHDIDPTNLQDVIWAMSTRSDPVRSVQIITRTLGGKLNPASPPAERHYTSRAIIDACRPYEWKDEFAPVVGISREMERGLRQKWRDLLS